MEYLHNKVIRFVKNIFKKKESNKVKIIFNMPREEFKVMLEKEIIPQKIFQVELSKDEVLRLMEIEDEVELWYGDYDKDVLITDENFNPIKDMRETNGKTKK